MKLRTILLAFFGLVLPLSAANISGKWLFARQSSGGRGPAPQVVILSQVGTELTGSVTPPRGNSTGSPDNVEIRGGKVEGDNVSFYLWTGLDKPVKNLYQGKVSGDEIVFTVTLDAETPGTNASRPFQVTAKRVP